MLAGREAYGKNICGSFLSRISLSFVLLPLLLLLLLVSSEREIGIQALL